MSINPNEDTEFNDALRKHGILPPREAPPPSPSPPPSPTFDDLLNDFTPSELRELGETAPDDETERKIESYRRQRLAEDKHAEEAARFGRVYPIGREDYTREVTDASKVDEEDDDNEKGTGVVCFLYKDGIPASDRAFEYIHKLAAKYPRTKFVSIVGDKCIPNLPDSRVPMIIIYRKGDIRNQLVAWGADKEKRIEELEAILMVTGAVEIPERRGPEDRRRSGGDDESDEEEIDVAARLRSGSSFQHAKQPKKNLRGPPKRKGDDDDSDFDFDL